MATLLGNRKTRDIALQSIFVAVIGAIIVTAILEARKNMAIQNVSMGFDFLGYSTGSGIHFTLIQYDVTSTYARALLVGFLNTLLLGGISVTLAVVLGTVIGTARLSGNRMLAWATSWYVQLFRNIPLILQLFFWYNLITHMPGPRGAFSVLGGLFISNRGIVMPALNVETGNVLLAALTLVVSGVLVVLILKRLGRNVAIAWTALSLVVIALILINGRLPDTSFLDIPQKKGLGFTGGMTVFPELTAAIVAIALFGAAYVAEVVRSGFKAIPPGQIEAAHALALNNWQIFWKVRLPLMIRIVLPTMTNQIIWLMKATTIGLAIGYSDFFGVIANSINNSGQTLSLIFILILGFWAVNLTIALVMNTINRAIAIPGHKK